MIRAASLCLILLAGSAAQAAPQAQIAPQPLADALTALARQSGLQLIYGSDAVRGRQTQGAPAGLSVQDVLAHVLKGTGLEYEFLNDRTVTIWVKGQQKPDFRRSDLDGIAGVLRVASAQPAGREAAASTEAAADETPEEKGIPEILVKGSRSLNADIRRTEDGVQPYVVFDARDIRNSLAGTVEEFLAQNLPMNASNTVSGQQPASALNDRTTIDLRGLGQDETLVLINGRRMPGFAGGTLAPGQTDLNGIPMSSVERIEILPATAGGIFGGGATGGVVNVITRQDYRGVDVSARYLNAFDTDAGEREFTLSGGFGLGNDRTVVNFTAMRTDSNALLAGDRDFIERARAQLAANNPAGLTGLTTPPMGGTTNIRSVSGQALVLKEGMRPLGSPIAHVPYGYAGPVSDAGAAFIATAGRYNLDVPEGLGGKGRSLKSQPVRQSVSASISHVFSDHFQMSLDGSYRENESVTRIGRFPTTAIVLPINAPNNPFTESIRVSFPAADFDYGADNENASSTLSVGVNGILRLPGNWSVQGDVTFGRSTREMRTIARATTNTMPAALANGTLDVMRDTLAHPLDYSAYLFAPLPTDYTIDPYASENRGYVLRAAGPVFGLPGGPVQLATSVERLETTMEAGFYAQVQTSGVTAYRYLLPRDSARDSYYVELTAPVFSPRKGAPGMRGLDLQLSYRNDQTTQHTLEDGTGVVPLTSLDSPIPPQAYIDKKVSASQYTVGLSYRPIDALTLRGSYGYGILPPSLTDLTPALLANIPLIGVIDPRRKNDPLLSVPGYSLSGFGELKPEQSDSLSFGLVFKTVRIPGLRASVDYLRIKKKDEIDLTSDAQLILDLEQYFPGRVVRNPLTEPDRLSGYTVGTVRDLYLGEINLARTRVEAWDANISYAWDTARGAFSAALRTSWQPHQQTLAHADAPLLENAGHRGSPKWRGTFGLTWDRDAWSAGWQAQYYDRYLVYTASASTSTRTSSILNQGNDTIAHQLYHDVFVRYRFGRNTAATRGFLADTDIKVGIANVLNTRAPIVSTTTSLTDLGYATNGDPRLRRYTLSLTKSFGN